MLFCIKQLKETHTELFSAVKVLEARANSAAVRHVRRGSCGKCGLDVSYVRTRG